MIYFILLLFITGLFSGSFLGVVVDRNFRKESFISGRSYCEFCKHELSWYDLIPVFSFLFLHGKCRYCRKKLSNFYPLVELFTGIVFLLAFLVAGDFGFTELVLFKARFMVDLIFYIFMFSSFVVIFFSDLKFGIVPDKIVFPAIAVNVAWLLLNMNILPNHLLTGAGTLLFFVLVSLIFYFFTKKVGFGGGDIKLSFLIGIFLGFPNVLVALYAAFLTGAIISIILILWGKKNFSRDSISFGPFLVTGIFLSLFFGNIILKVLFNF